MPKKLHEKLEKQAKKKGLTGDLKDKNVYGGLYNATKKSKKK